MPDLTRYYREPDGNFLKLEVYRDENPCDPRVEWDNPSVIVCFHGRYLLGDVRVGHGGATRTIPGTNVRYDNSGDGASDFAEFAKSSAAA